MRELEQLPRRIRVLDMATGHGYTAAVIAGAYGHMLENLVAYDINPQAVDLATRNLELNGVDMTRVSLRTGSLYEPLRPGETFDLILSALPPVPATREDIEALPDEVRVHHWASSPAGPSGRDLLDQMISEAYKWLAPRGIVLTAQNDIQNANRTTAVAMAEAGLRGRRVGVRVPIPLGVAGFTSLMRPHIESLGYQFRKDSSGNDFFYVEIWRGDRVDRR